MQKFTRPLTREVECAGERLAFTFSEQGMTIRPVGSRKPPREISWGELLCSLTGRAPVADAPPTADELAGALQHLKTAAPAARPAKPTAADEPTHAPAKPPQAGAESSPRAKDYTALLARLESWLAQHRPRYLHGLQHGASAAELDALQTELGAPLPAGLRTLLAWHNGQKPDLVGSFVDNRLLMSTQAIAAAKKELDADTTGEASKGGWKRSLIPFLDDNGGDYLCDDSSDPAEPVRGYYPGATERPAEAPSLAAWLEDFVAAVERGEYHEDPERGEFRRSK